MTKHYEVECDKCKTRAPMKYNGEHHIEPQDWVEIVQNTRTVGHICPKCNPLSPKGKK